MKKRDILSADQFDWEFLEALFGLAEEMRTKFRTQTGRDLLRRLFTRRVIYLLFDQPSTRTFKSFWAAATYLGINCGDEKHAREFSSEAKGESLAHTLRTLSGHQPDLFIIRRKTDQNGEIAGASRSIRTPVINAGEGTFEHPTQALLDAYTIWRKFGRLDNLTIGIGGDLAKGRTIHSLVRVLSKMKSGQTIKFVGVCPEELGMPDSYRSWLEDLGIMYEEVHSPDSISDALADADVWYWTRCQIEHENDPAQIERFVEQARQYAVGRTHLERMKDGAILMHPLPIDQKVQDISNEVMDWGMLPVEERPAPFDKVRVFEQSDNGLWVRMALIFWVINGHFKLLG